MSSDLAPGRAAGRHARARAEDLMKNSLERRIAWRSLLAAALIAGAGIATYLSLTGSQDTVRRVERSHEALYGLETLISLLKDAETGQRGYLLTGRERYLEPYQRARAELDRQLAALSVLLRDEPGQRARLESLRAPIDEKFSELRETIEARRRGAPEEALRIVLTDQGKQVMGKIRAIIRATQDEEMARLDRLAEQSSAGAATAVLVAVGGILLALGVLVMAYRLMARELTARREAERALQDRTGALEEAQARLTASAEFSAALNRPGALETYQSALGCIARLAGAPVTALYDAAEGQTPVPRCAVGPDLRPLDAAPLRGEGLPAAVARDGEARELCGPFDDEELSLRLGLGDVRLRVVAGWPLTFRGRSLGVLVTAHTRPIDDATREFIRSSLSQLAVRMDGYQVDQQRIRLLADLQDRSRDLESARQEAERANRAKSEFLAAMSHELRTPMNSIMGFTARLIRKLGGTLPERERDALETIDRNAKHLLNLINDILDLAKIEADKMEAHFAPVDLSDAVREAADQTASLLDGKPVELALDLPDRRIVLEADARMIRQVTLNLVSNAIKFTERGTVRVSVEEVDDERLGRSARIAVRDTGIGIAPEDLPRLFQRFTQLNGGPSRKSGGTGLGLALAERLTSLHGGRIDVSSELGQGSEFAVLLPLAPRPAAAPARRPADPSASRPSPRRAPERPAGEPGAGLTILCVDDEPDTLKYLGLTFEEAGYHAILAEGHDEALERAREERPDLICLDLAMPGKDGFEVLKSIRADPALAAVPVVVVSALAEEARALAAGARRYMPKPTSADDLVDAVRELIGPAAGEVLIVEDDGDTRRLLSAILSERGLRVRTACDGREGLDRMAEGLPSAVVLDLMMPVMDGFAFLEHLGRDPAWSRVPVVVSTARALEPTEAAELGRVAASILVKGKSDAEDLIDAVLRAARPRRREEAVLS